MNEVAGEIQSAADYIGKITNSTIAKNISYVTGEFAGKTSQLANGASQVSSGFVLLSYSAANALLTASSSLAVHHLL